MFAPARRACVARRRCWPSLAVALAGCATIREGARRPGPATRSLGELEPQGLQLQRRPRQRACSSRSRPPIPTSCPQPVRRGVTNFFSNFADAWSAVNNMLQGKFAARLRGRDPGRHEHAVRPVRHPRRRVARWASSTTTRTSARRSAATASAPAPTSSCRSSGPSTVRDAAALPLDRLATPPAHLRRHGHADRPRRCCSSSTPAPSLLGATRVIDEIALDKYTFIRDAYLQRRRSLVFDGDVPETPAAPDEAASAAAGAASVAPPAPAPRRRRQRPRRSRAACRARLGAAADRHPARATL